MTSGSAASDGILKTGKIDLSDQKAENLEGKTIEINYGDKNYTVTLPSGSDYKYDSVDNIVKSLNKAFENVELDGGKKLNDVLAVETKGDRIVFKDKVNNGNIFKLTRGTALSHLGFKDKPDSEFKEMDITSAGLGATVNITEDDIFTKTPFIDRIAGKELTFTYNGVSKSYRLPEKDALNNGDILDTLRTSMQKQLDDAFGDGRIKVSANSGGLQFKTTVPGGGNDTSSVLSVSSGSAGLLGENGALNMNYGESNRVNMEAKISESGLITFKEGTTFPATITINGVDDIKVEESDTVRTLMDKINNSDAGVEVNYQNSSDKFVFTSKKDGASGKISVGGDFENIFGTSFNKTDGQDAIVAVKYAGSDKEVEIVRDSNSFKIDGMTISVNGEFGYKAGAGGKLELDKTSDPVTFDAKVDEDKIVETIKKMVEEYNEIIELVGKETGTKPNRDYEPLDFCTESRDRE